MKKDFKQELTELINKHCLEKEMRDTPDFILAQVCIDAMAEFFGKMFPGSKVEIHRVEMPKRNPRDKRRAKNKRKGGNNGKK